MGDFEQIVLLALLRLGNEAYGMQLREEIEARTGREVSIGAIYRTLDRLHGKGFVSHRMGDPTPARGGRAKKFFRVEKRAIESLGHARRTMARMWEGVSLRAAGTAP